MIGNGAQRKSGWSWGGEFLAADSEEDETAVAGEQFHESDRLFRRGVLDRIVPQASADSLHGSGLVQRIACAAMDMSHIEVVLQLMELKNGTRDSS